MRNTPQEHLVQRTYKLLAPMYDRLWSRYLKRTLAFLHEWTQPPPDARLLDLGCGSGRFAQRLLHKQPQQLFVGSDLSPEMLAIARRRCVPFPHATFHVASMTALPLADTSFDVIVSASALHYVDDPGMALREMRRVLNTDGRVTILDWCRDYLFCHFLDWIVPWIDPAHRRTYTQAELHQFLTDAGFTIERAQRKRFGFVWGLMIVTARPQQD